jgi:sialic acid synthase SpsE
MSSVEIGGVKVGDGNPVYVVAEMAWSHDGTVENGKKIIDIAAAGGAQAINMHLTSVADYIVPNYGLDISPLADNKDPNSAFNYLANINLSFGDFKNLAAHARSLGLSVSIMCNDDPSLDYAAAEINPEILMIHPSCVGDRDFVARVAEKANVLLLYVGGLSLGEIERSVIAAREAGCDSIILQHGFQSYPTPIEENNLHYIPTLKKLFDVPVAFGDHTDGGDPFALVIPAVATGVGANLIEKHLTHDRSVKGEDHESALDGTTFATFVEHLRATETSLGADNWRPLGNLEKNYRNVVRKRAVASKEIAEGEVISMENVIYMRSKTGYYPEEIDAALGRKAKRTIVVNEPITADVIA